MQITKPLLDLILQFRCPNGDFDSFDAKAMQNHLLICGETNQKLLHHQQQLTFYQNLPLVKIKEEIKIEDTLDEPKIPVQPASKIDEDSKALFNSLIGKLDEISVPRGVPYSRFGPPAPPKKLFVPVNGPAVPTELRPDMPLIPLSPRVLPTEPRLLLKPKLLKPVKTAPYHLWKSDETFCESKENEELTQLRPDLPPTSLSHRGLARHNLPAQPSFLVRPKLLEPLKPVPYHLWKSDNTFGKSIDEDLQVMFQFLLTF